MRDHLIEEKHSDPLDQASHLADLHNMQSLEMARLKAAPEQVQDADGNWPETECVDCGEDIGEVRLSLGKVRCIGCQEAKEIRIKRGLR